MTNTLIPDQWVNRIVGYGEEDPEQLLANDYNWRTHPRHQQAAMVGILDRLGFIQAIMVNRTTHKVIDGHMRAEIAISKGQKKVPVVYVELDDAEEKEALATFDPIGAMAGRDSANLDALLHEVQAGVDLDGLLASLADASGLLDQYSPTFDASFRPSNSPTIDVPSYTADDVAGAAGKLAGQFSGGQSLKDVTCPACGEVFYVGS